MLGTMKKYLETSSYTHSLLQKMGGTGRYSPGSMSLNKFKICEGVMILASPPGKYGGVPMEFRKPSEGEMTYAEVREEFFKPYLVQSDSDSGDDSDSGEEEEEEYEVEKIVSHRILSDGTVKYRVRWKGYDYRSDS